MRLVIVSVDTARAIGLRWIAERYFDIDACIVSPGESAAADLDEAETPATIYVADADVCCSMSDFFIPRRSRTIVVGALPGMLRMGRSEGEIVEELRRRLEGMSAIAAEQSVPGLSQREIEVLRHVALGHINKEIADALGISINTVLSHRKNITSKLGIRSASGLSVYAMMNGYLSQSELH